MKNAKYEVCFKHVTTFIHHSVLEIVFFMKWCLGGFCRQYFEYSNIVHHRYDVYRIVFSIIHFISYLCITLHNIWNINCWYQKCTILVQNRNTSQHASVHFQNGHPFNSNNLVCFTHANERNIFKMKRGNQKVYTNIRMELMCGKKIPK